MDDTPPSDRARVLAPGHVAVITGGAGGIGLGLAEAMVDEGMRVVLADIDAPKLRATEARLAERGAEIATQVCDTTVQDEVDALIEFALERFGAVHVMCNNAGITGVGDAWAGPMDLWHRVVAVNLYGVVHGIRAALPVMQDQGLGHIVNTASLAGLMASPGIAPYHATKHAVVGLTETLHLELEATGSPVGTSVLCPAFVKTDLMDKEPVEIDHPIGQFSNQMLRAGVEGGIATSDVADQVLAAIRANRFWILTHDETLHLPVERMQKAATGVNPTLFGAET